MICLHALKSNFYELLKIEFSPAPAVCCQLGDRQTELIFIHLIPKSNCYSGTFI